MQAATYLGSDMACSPSINSSLPELVTWPQLNYKGLGRMDALNCESPFDCKEIQPVRSEGDQPWDFFGRNDAKAEAPVLWTPHAKS